MSTLQYKSVLLMSDDSTTIIPYIPPATVSTLGTVKPDGTSLTVDDTGTLHASASLSGNVGSSVNPIYLEEGELKASESTLGTGITPIYLDNGVLTQCTKSIPDTTDFVKVTQLIESVPLIYKYSSGTTWYNIWANRFAMMGGIATRTKNEIVTVTIPYTKGFASSNYIVVSNVASLPSNYSSAKLVSMYSVVCLGRTTTKFILGANSAYNATTSPYFAWIALGFVASL